MISDRWESRGIAKGTLRIASSVEPGRLDQLIELEYARPVLDRDLAEGVVIAAKKSKEIEDSRAVKELAASERRLHSGPELSSSRRLDLEELWNHQPSKADLAKRAADGIAGSAQERERQRVIDESLREAAEKDAAKQSAGRAKVHQAEPPKQWPEALH